MMIELYIHTNASLYIYVFSRDSSHTLLKWAHSFGYHPILVQLLCTIHTSMYRVYTYVPKFDCHSGKNLNPLHSFVSKSHLTYTNESQHVKSRQIASHYCIYIHLFSFPGKNFESRTKTNPYSQNKTWHKLNPRRELRVSKG